MNPRYIPKLEGISNNQELDTDLTNNFVRSSKFRMVRCNKGFVGKAAATTTRETR
jgi:hypothetical protein